LGGHLRGGIPLPEFLYEGTHEWEQVKNGTFLSRSENSRGGQKKQNLKEKKS